MEAITELKRFRKSRILKACVVMYNVILPSFYPLNSASEIILMWVCASISESHMKGSVRSKHIKAIFKVSFPHMLEVM